MTGRDVEEMVYKVTFSDTGKWEANGTDLADAADKVTENRLGEGMQTVQAAGDQWTDPVSPKEVSEATGLPVATVRKYLSRLHERGIVHRPAVGKYQSVSVSEVSPDRETDREATGQSVAA